MYGLTLKAQEAIRKARGTLNKALMAAMREDKDSCETSHLSCLNYQMMAAQFTAALAVEAAPAAGTMKVCACGERVKTARG